MKSKKQQPTTIDAYIADFPKDVQERLEKVRITKFCVKRNLAKKK
jgi:hypothetical protein